MAGDSAQDRTEAATPKRREESRAKGDVVDSKDLASGFTIFGVAMLLVMFGPEVIEGLKNSIRLHFGAIEFAQSLATKEGAVELIRHSVTSSFAIVAPIVAAIVVVALAAQFAMHGLVWSPKKLEFNLEKIDPFKGMNKIFSVNGVATALLAVVKLIVIASVTFVTLRTRWPDILIVPSLPVTGGAVLMADVLLSIVVRTGLAMLIIGVADWAFQKWRWERGMRMSLQDVRDERKQAEGDPRFKSRVRERARKLSNRRMLDDVDSASVVVTNPTHYAVALTYERGESVAPKVVAKGADELALKIRERAEAAGVPILERPPLARELFRLVEVGDDIPADLYRAVAAVLSFVYRMRGATS